MITGRNYLWQIKVCDTKKRAEIAARYNISMPVAEILLNRGYTTTEHIEEFLFESEKHCHNPALLKDAEKAVLRIQKAIKNKEKILISGDYDVDGITASSLMMTTLIPLNAQVNFFLPNRAVDGYGLSVTTIKKAAANGYTVVITVDNGITAHEAAFEAKKLGIDLIITDHHRPKTELPDAYAIINPQQHDCQYPFKYLAGVGVSFKLISLLYEKEKKEIPQKAYELLLLGTVADVVPLLKENRYFVQKGLHQINETESISLSVLKKNNNVKKEKISSIDIGFFITPQLNALGRLDDPRDAVKFLIGTDAQHIEEVGKHLLNLNETRKKLEKNYTEEVQKKIERKIINIEEDLVIIDASTTFPVGVIGLIASRLVSLYNRPAIIFCLSDDGTAKGSCRSIPEVNIFNMLESCSDLLLKFGGHAQAAGLSLKTENIPLLKQKLKEILSSQEIKYHEKAVISVDAYLDLSDANAKLVDDLAYLEPFGHHNDVPVFFFRKLHILYPPKLLKEAHVKLQIFSAGAIREIMFFNRPDLFNFFTNLEGQECAVVAKINENFWNGKKSIELIGIDVCLEKDIKE